MPVPHTSDIVQAQHPHINMKTNRINQILKNIEKANEVPKKKNLKFFWIILFAIFVIWIMLIIAK